MFCATLGTLPFADRPPGIISLRRSTDEKLLLSRRDQISATLHRTRKFAHCIDSRRPHWRTSSTVFVSVALGLPHCLQGLTFSFAARLSRLPGARRRRGPYRRLRANPVGC